jgi:cytochrome c oxidase cbb3-type subunit 3
LRTDLDQLTARREAVFAGLKDKSIPEIAATTAAASLGRSIFVANCAGCHGADARGALGYPNLTDKDWLFGGTPEQIVETITHGRTAQMPAFGTMLSAETLEALVDFVPYWSDAGLSEAKRERGMKQFAGTCAACHGPDGKGNQAMGAPNLTDDIWLFGGSRKQVRDTIMWGRQGAMPAHENLLAPEEIRVVAAYVWGLSNNPAAPQKAAATSGSP